MTARRGAAAALLATVACLAVACGPQVTTVGLQARNATGPSDDWLKPVLAWETFPRPADRHRDPRLARVRDVTYELRIWRAGSQYATSSWRPFVDSDDLVYSRTGLIEPRHAVESSLDPTTVYAVSVRARFDLDGERRVTRWGARALPHPDLQYLLLGSIVPTPRPALYHYAPPVPAESRAPPQAPRP